ncbi:MAG: Ldh family oxidoreductase [Rhodospirillaceae bacterium]|jgi:LDH2 family malate/lactate/ureidoglycolate dehydrogenase|nr:Ldh family oxidoreductase [Rhodospirillaceae bacterium]
MTNANSNADFLDDTPPGAVRMSVQDATALGERALKTIGFSHQDTHIILGQLIDNALCGYPFTSLPRILAIAQDPKTKQPRKPVSVTHETPASALLDGGNNVGYVAVYKAAEIAIEKAKSNRFSVVGAYDSYYSGRNAYFVEKIVNAGFVTIHLACGQPHVVPPGGARPAMGTNPICIGFPTAKDPVIVDMGTAALQWGEVMLHAHIDSPLPEGVGVDGDGMPTRDAKKALLGGVLPFGGHKGFGLSMAIQAMGLLAGAAIPRGNVQDYGFLFITFDPGLLIPADEFAKQASELIHAIKETPKQAGVDEIRIPSERAFRERERRRREGIVFEQKVVDALNAL